MVRMAGLLLASVLAVSPLHGQATSTERQADSLRTLLRPIVRNHDRIRVIQGSERFIVDQPRAWLDTLRRPMLLDRVQVRGNSSATGAKIGAVVGVVAGSIAGVAAGVAVANICIFACPGPSSVETGRAALLGGLVGGVGGAMVGVTVGALIGLAIPSWHTRISVRPDGRIQIR